MFAGHARFFFYFLIKTVKTVIFRRIMGENNHVESALRRFGEDMVLDIRGNHGIRTVFACKCESPLVQARAAEARHPFDGRVSVNEYAFRGKIRLRPRRKLPDSAYGNGENSAIASRRN